MLIHELMKRDVATVSPLATIREAMQIMQARKVKSLVVERRDAHDVYGIITYTNILKTIVAEDGDIDLIHVYDVCAKPALTISANTHVNNAARMMVNMKVRRLVVLEADEMVGILTMNDIVGDILKMATRPGD
jgi:signal-transduction protein with cAMP-binding, CBS, and nucleotidyltransferase domain